MRPPFSLFLSRSCSPFFFLDLLDFFSLTLLELEDVEDDPAGEDTEECLTLSVRLVAEMAEETEEALEVVEAGEPGREVEAARLAGRAVAVGTEAGGACSAPESIFDSEEDEVTDYVASSDVPSPDICATCNCWKPCDCNPITGSPYMGPGQKNTLKHLCNVYSPPVYKPLKALERLRR